MNQFPFNASELKLFLLSGLEELCNRALNYDQASRLALQQLESKSLRIESQLPLYSQSFDFIILFCEDGLIFTVDEFVETDAELQANNFLTIARFFSGRYVSGQGDEKLHISGDLDLVNEVQDIFSELDIDWEEPLSKITGDVVAHEIGRFVDDAGKAIKKASEFFETELDEGLNRLSKLFFGRATHKHTASVNRTVREQDFDHSIEDIHNKQLEAENRISNMEQAKGKKDKEYNDG